MFHIAQVGKPLKKDPYRTTFGGVLIGMIYPQNYARFIFVAVHLRRRQINPENGCYPKLKLVDAVRYERKEVPEEWKKLKAEADKLWEKILLDTSDN